MSRHQKQPKYNENMIKMFIDRNKYSSKLKYMYIVNKGSTKYNYDSLTMNNKNKQYKSFFYKSITHLRCEDADK